MVIHWWPSFLPQNDLVQRMDDKDARCFGQYKSPFPPKRCVNFPHPPMSPFPPKRCECLRCCGWKSAQTSGRQKIIFRRLSGTKGPDVTRHILYDNIPAPAPGPIHLWSWIIISSSMRTLVQRKELCLHAGAGLSLYVSSGKLYSTLSF